MMLLPTTTRIVARRSAITWWEAASKAGKWPLTLKPLVKGKREEARVSTAVADYIREWGRELPGWDEGPLEFYKID